MSREAARRVNRDAVERLIALETGDVDVPVPPRTNEKPPLYFRILSPTTNDLRVELWELGAPYGYRRVSSAGTENLRARRIALAAGELARQLRRRRLAELDEARRADSLARAARRDAPGFPVYARFAFDAGAAVAAVGLGDAWFVGPTLDAALVFSSGQELQLGAAWLAGDATRGGSRSRWLEGQLAFAQRFSITPGSAVAIGARAAIASLRIDGFSSPGGEAPFDAVDARATLFATFELRLARHLSLAIGPDVGALLHPLTTRAADGSDRRIAGLWLGAMATVRLDPASGE